MSMDMDAGCTSARGASPYAPARLNASVAVTVGRSSFTSACTLLLLSPVRAASSLTLAGSPS